MKSSKKSFIAAIAILYAGFIVYGAAFQISGAALELLKVHFEKPVATVGYLVSAYSFGRIVALFFSGKLVDKFGAKTGVILGMLLPLLMFFTVPLSKSLNLALLTTGLCGAGHALVDNGCMRTFLLGNPGKYSSLMGFCQFTFSFGGMAVPLSLGLLVSRGQTFAWAYYGLGILMAVIFVITLFIEFPKNELLVAGKASNYTTKGKVFPDFILMVSIMVAYSIFSSVLLTFIGTYSVEYLGIPYETGVNFITVFTIGGALLSLVFSALLHKVHGTFFLMFNAALSVLTAAGALFIPDTGVRFVFFFLTGGLVSMAYPLLIGVLGDYFPKATYLPGFLMMSCAATYVIVPIVVRYAMKFFGLDIIMTAAFTMLIFETAVGIVLRFRYVKHIKPLKGV